MNGAELVIKVGALLETHNKAGWAPIHYAAQENRVDVLKMFVLLGANPKFQTVGGFTPFHVAVQFGHIDIISLLFEIGDGIKVDDSAKSGHMLYILQLNMDSLMWFRS